jgi:hypothetical protein
MTLPPAPDSIVPHPFLSSVNISIQIAMDILDSLRSTTRFLSPGCISSVSPAFMSFRVRSLTARRLGLAGIVTTGALLLAGCATVPVWKQERVSKPNMVFNDRGAFVYGPRLNAQIESGSADNGGASAAGCTACK